MTKSGIELAANMHAPSFIQGNQTKLKEAQIGAARSKTHNPIEINMSSIPDPDQVVQDTNTFYKDTLLNPSTTFPPPTGTNPPHDDLQMIASLNDNSERQQAAKRIVDSIMKDGNTPSPIVNKQSSAMRALVTEFSNTVENELNPALTVNMGVNQKVVKLKELYEKTEDSINKIHETELKEFDQWFNDQKKDLATVYPQQFGSTVEKSEENFKKLYDQQRNAILKRQQDEKAYFDSVRNSLAAAVYDVNAYNAIVLGNYFANNNQLHNPRSGIANFSTENPIKDGTYHDRYGCEIKVKNKTASCDLRNVKGLSESAKINKMIDSALAVRHADLQERAEEIDRLRKAGKFDEIEKLPPLRIKISAQVRDYKVPWFSTEQAKYTDQMPQTSYFLSLQWRAAIQAGYKPDEIDSPGFEPSQEDLKFARNYMAKESYKGLGEVNGTLQKKLTENSDSKLDPSRLQRVKDFFVKNNYQRNKENSVLLNENTVPVLTDNDINEINSNINPFKYDANQKADKHPASLEAMRDEFNKIRPGLGDMLLGEEILKRDPTTGKITGEGKDFEKAAEFLRSMRSDYINNTVVRDFLLKGKNDAGEHVIDLLTREQIDAINKLKFEQCKTPKEVAEKIQESINIPGAPKINLEKMDFGFKANPKHHEVNQQDQRSQYTIASDNMLKVKDVIKAQKEGDKRVAITTPSEAILKTRLDDNKKQLTTIQKEINESLAKIKDIKSNQPMSKTDFDKYQEHCRNLVTNYNLLSYYTKQQVELLNQMHEKIEKSQGFTKASVADAYKAIALEHRDDIVKSINMLSNAGEIPTGKVDENNIPEYETVVEQQELYDAVDPSDKPQANMSGFYQNAQTLTEKGDELAQKITTSVQNSTKNPQEKFTSISGKPLTQDNQPVVQPKITINSM